MSKYTRIRLKEPDYPLYSSLYTDETLEARSKKPGLTDRTTKELRQTVLYGHNSYGNNNLNMVKLIVMIPCKKPTEKRPLKKHTIFVPCRAIILNKLKNVI